MLLLTGLPDESLASASLYTRSGEREIQKAGPPVSVGCSNIFLFLGVQTEKASMQSASPMAKAIMWSAGVTSSAAVPTLSALWAWHSGVPWSKPFFLFALFWAAGTLVSNWRSPTGDYAKARRALGNS